MSTPESATKTTYRAALGAALHRAMQTYPEALVFGEDVARPGGVFGVTRGLADEFGDRVFDTPISESAMLGAALGAAMIGRRPIVEIMWADFLFVGIDQLVNQAANVRWLTRGGMTAPLTVRTQQGSLTSSSAQHSRCVEALLCHIPGLRVGLPSNPGDAYTMLLAAIADDDPTIVIEHRAIYDQRGEVDLTCRDPAHRRRHDCQTRERRDRRRAVADGRVSPSTRRSCSRPRASTPRSSTPAGCRRSTGTPSRHRLRRRTGWWSCTRPCRPAGSAPRWRRAAAERGFWHLDGPVVRVTAPDCPKPSAPALEAVAIPDAERIARGVRQALAGAAIDEKESG